MGDKKTPPTMTRRQFLILSGQGAAALAVLSACGGGGAEEAPSSEAPTDQAEFFTPTTEPTPIPLETIPPTPEPTPTPTPTIEGLSPQETEIYEKLMAPVTPKEIEETKKMALDPNTYRDILTAFREEGWGLDVTKRPTNNIGDHFLIVNGIPLLVRIREGDTNGAHGTTRPGLNVLPDGKLATAAIINYITPAGEFREATRSAIQEGVRIHESLHAVQLAYLITKFMLNRGVDPTTPSNLYLQPGFIQQFAQEILVPLLDPSTFEREYAAHIQGAATILNSIYDPVLIEKKDGAKKLYPVVRDPNNNLSPAVLLRRTNEENVFEIIINPSILPVLSTQLLRNILEGLKISGQTDPASLWEKLAQSVHSLQGFPEPDCLIDIVRKNRYHGEGVSKCVSPSFLNKHCHIIDA